MSEQILKLIYGVSKKYQDPSSNNVLDEKNRDLRILYEKGTVTVTLSINPQKHQEYNDLINKLKKEIEQINGVSSVNIALTSEKINPASNEDKRFKINANNIIAIASGKGGVGKSTFAVNFAIAMSLIGKSVGVLDADIYGPSIPKMMGISKKPEINSEKKLIPIEKHGIKCMSIGFLVDVETPTIWRGPMIMKALEQMFNGVEWGNLDYLIIDLPPGTGDTQISLAQNAKLSGSIILSTPQDIALIDAIKGINMFRRVNVPILGIVENMSYFICNECNKKHYIFSNGGAKNEADKNDIPFLGDLPIDIDLRKNSDLGNPACISNPNGKISISYTNIAKNINQKLNS
tara:strand:- start:980 stop:2020 length:1041 start_codon:yes stop_codon:yes gene_type:complete